MTEHRIRLRGGWECTSRDEGGEGPEVVRRLGLPAPSSSDLPGRFRLTRQFGRPPVDLRTEVVALELAHVPGLRSGRLNGRPIALGDGEVCDVSIPIEGPLLARNGLVLEVVLEGRAEAPGPWGEIALVIRPR